MAIPTIFDDDCAEVDCAEEHNDHCEQCGIFQEQIRTLVLRCNELQEKRERNGALLNQTIQHQSVEIFKLKQLHESQMKEMMTLKNMNKNQRDEIRKAMSQLNDNEQKMNSNLIQFAINGNDPKVRTYIAEIS